MTQASGRSSGPTAQRYDRPFRLLTQITAYSVLIMLVGIAISLLWQGWPAFRQFGFGFLVSNEWDPVSEHYGALSPVFGTLLTSAIALIIAVPVSLGIAVFITELAPAWLQRPVSTAIEMLAGIPSVIFGMWGLFIFAPVFAGVEPWLTAHLGPLPWIGLLFQGPPMGIGVLSASIILSIMVVPFISSIMREVFLLTPAMLKESAYGLGATTWEVVWNVVLPYTKTAVVGGVFLGLGRALGETMAVTFIIGNAHQISASLLAPGTSISAVLANEFSEATTPMYRSSLLALGFILFVITFAVLVLAKLMLLRLQNNEGQA
jgi:phosphate transport system permease protein